jgi:transketolase
MGGSADLTPSNNTRSKESETYAPFTPKGRYIHFGIREHAMAAAMNGMALHGGIIPFGGTFLTFSDYCRPAIRLSALMKQRVIYIMTHDSIGLGEDGPTHQPIEHLASLRAIPNLTVFRPADVVETIEAWEYALKNTEGPTLIALTRQALPALRAAETDQNALKGAYILADHGENSDQKASLYATGSEVSLAMEAHEALKAEGIASRVISVPSWEVFDKQDGSYKESILCQAGPKIACEAACSMGWEKFIGPHGTFIGMKGFGLSAPYKELYKHFGITSENIISNVKRLLNK